MRSFNTAGPVNATDHYLIAPLSRIDLDEVLGLVRDKEVLRAACAATDRENVGAAGAGRCVERARLRLRLRYGRKPLARRATTCNGRCARCSSGWRRRRGATLDDGFLDDIWPDVLARVGADEALGEALSRWAEASPLPLVLLIDEIDALVGDSLLSVLQQIRAGYPGRPARFPHSVVLCGMRDLRDYRMGAAGSPFNIAAKSLRLGDFSREQTQALLGQHTEDTGQAFAPEALEAVWAQTRGQPWLVNALAYGACFENRALRENRARTVTVDDIAAVREDLIVNRVTHLDYLADKLREDRVRRLIEPMLSGSDRHAFTDRDIAYARDLGLVARDAAVAGGQPDLRRSAAARTRVGGAGDAGCVAAAVREDGRQPGRGVADGGVPGLLPPPLGTLAEPLRVRGGVAAVAPAGILAARGERRRPHRAGICAGEREGGPADRVAAGGPRAGVRGGSARVVREHDGLERVVDEGVEQTARYVDRCAAEAGHLVVIDRRENRSWEEKVFHLRRGGGAVPVDVWGM